MPFFFNDTATTEIYTLSLHDALPIFLGIPLGTVKTRTRSALGRLSDVLEEDRKSTRLNSSHRCISYAVFCLKKKNSKGASKQQHNNHSIARHYQQQPAATAR